MVALVRGHLTCSCHVCAFWVCPLMFVPVSNQQGLLGRWQFLCSFFNTSDFEQKNFWTFKQSRKRHSGTMWAQTQSKKVKVQQNFSVTVIPWSVVCRKCQSLVELCSKRMFFPTKKLMHGEGRTTDSYGLHVRHWWPYRFQLFREKLFHYVHVCRSIEGRNINLNLSTHGGCRM